MSSYARYAPFSLTLILAARELWSMDADYDFSIWRWNRIASLFLSLDYFWTLYAAIFFIKFMLQKFVAAERFQVWYERLEMSNFATDMLSVLLGLHIFSHLHSTTEIDFLLFWVAKYQFYSIVCSRKTLTWENFWRILNGCYCFVLLNEQTYWTRR